MRHAELGGAGVRRVGWRWAVMEPVGKMSAQVFGQFLFLLFQNHVLLYN